MGKKRAILAIVGLLAGLVLVVALVGGAIVGFVFYTIDQSGAAHTAKDFLRHNQKLKQDIGDVRDFGYFTTGDIKTQGSLGTAELRLKTIGARKSVNATVDLAMRRDAWSVIDAFYTDDSGARVYLTNNFGDDSSPDTSADATRGGGASDGDSSDRHQTPGDAGSPNADRRANPANPNRRGASQPPTNR
ncbi:MAG: hypothetical protein ABR563_17885 [Pyrinomonadaceae bacterium]